MSRTLSQQDLFISRLDRAVSTVFGVRKGERLSPARDCKTDDLSDGDRRHIAGLMRINHTGEVCAQALYQGQEVTARRAAVKEAMARSADEEDDHLDWCKGRLDELGDRTSLLNPLWYAGSFMIGVGAGLAGDRWSLGFVAETERQVVKHLESHLQQIPASDEKSRAILEQMKIDEGNHATHAMEHGAADLPPLIQRAMTLTSKVMTSLTYRI